MKRALRIIPLAVIAAFLPAPAIAQGGPQENASPAAKRRADAGGALLGGTPGRIAKFRFPLILVDSNITEDAAGKVGIGTTAPTSPLTVNGLVETTGAGGGIKFPDGTVQTTAGQAGVVRDGTLKGTGTQASPLGVAFPLTLSGPDDDTVLRVTNTFLGDAITATGGPSGVGVRAQGGTSGADGVVTTGGFSVSVLGGAGVRAVAGNSDIGNGGRGVSATGGTTNGGIGGDGVESFGGRALSDSQSGSNSLAGTGGRGIRALGGAGSGVGKRGGDGIETFPGPGMNGATAGLAGDFHGDVQVTGTLTKGGGSFKIDHPLDPENRYLSHSFVESPDMKNIYDGVVSLDANGEAVVEMPEWFGALNRDYRYLLTALGAPMPGLYIAEEMANNRFKISGGMAGMRVSWQVTGIRQDAWANRNRIPVEELKSETERGYYLHPEAFDQPEERGITWAHEPELMRKDKERRLETQKMRQPSE